MRGCCASLLHLQYPNASPVAGAHEHPRQPLGGGRQHEADWRSSVPVAGVSDSCLAWRLVERFKKANGLTGLGCFGLVELK